MPHGLTRNKATRVASAWMLGRCQARRSCVRIRRKRKKNFCSVLIGLIRGATWNLVIGPRVTSRLNRMAESHAQSTHLPCVAPGGRHITATCQSVQPHQCHASFCTATCELVSGPRHRTDCHVNVRTVHVSNTYRANSTLKTPKMPDTCHALGLPHHHADAIMTSC